MAFAKARCLTSVLVTVCLCLAMVLGKLVAASGESQAERPPGALVFSFDDGFPNWVTLAAPEFAAVEGVATGYVNNQRIQRKQVAADDLLVLQDRYGWEIGTHTYHHHNASEFVKRMGLEAWLRDEVDASIKELRNQGLKIASLAFPFNDYTPELLPEVRKRFSSYRRVDAYPNAAYRDGSVPGICIDLAHYVPVDILRHWVDLAAARGRQLFLYAHDVQRDDAFQTFIVQSVDDRKLVLDREISSAALEDQGGVVPNAAARNLNHNLRVERVEGRVLTVSGGSLQGTAIAGSRLIVGPAYAMRISDLRELLSYSRGKLRFLTVSQAVSEASSSEHGQKTSR